MANFNYKNKFTLWATQLGLCIIASFGPVEAVALDGPIKKIEYEELQCLVQNGYFEARSDGYASVLAVTMVVLNRVNDSRYPNNICDVVYQGPTYINWKGNKMPVRHKCQFSWYCDGKSDIMYDEKLKVLVEIMVFEALSLWQNNIDITEGATHYHANYVYPKWAHQLAYTTQIGTHKYYKWN